MYLNYIEQHWPRGDKKRSRAGKTKAIKVVTNNIGHEVTNNLNNLLMPVKLAKFTLWNVKTLERITSVMREHTISTLESVKRK